MILRIKYCAGCKKTYDFKKFADGKGLCEECAKTKSYKKVLADLREKAKMYK